MVVSPRAIGMNWMMFGCRNFELISISLSTIRSSLTHSVVTTVEEISIQGERFSRADKSIAENNTSLAVPKVFVKDLNIDFT
jgi:hypothetical protein